MCEGGSLDRWLMSITYIYLFYLSPQVACGIINSLFSAMLTLLEFYEQLANHAMRWQIHIHKINSRQSEHFSQIRSSHLRNVRAAVQLLVISIKFLKIAH